MGWKHYQTVDPTPPKRKREPQSVGDCLVSIYQFLTSNFNFPNPSNLPDISYFPQFNLSFEKKYLFPKMPKNHSKIFTKLPNSGYDYKHRDLPLLET